MLSYLKPTMSTIKLPELLKAKQHGRLSEDQYIFPEIRQSTLLILLILIIIIIIFFFFK